MQAYNMGRRHNQEFGRETANMFRSIPYWLLVHYLCSQLLSLAPIFGLCLHNKLWRREKTKESKKDEGKHNLFSRLLR